MSSVNSYLSSTAYHAPTARYASSSSNPSTTSAFNIRSTNVQQPLNDLNSTRSSNLSCATSHCLSNQCLECSTILSTRPFQNRSHSTTYNDQTLIESISTLDHHRSISPIDESSSTRVLSMNIPVDSHDNNPIDCSINSSSLNIGITEENANDDHDDDDDQDPDRSITDDRQSCRSFQLNSEDNEQLEVFVGFYRAGEYQCETSDDEDDRTSKETVNSQTQNKVEQSTHHLISDDDEGNEDQDFIDADFGPNQDEDNDQSVNQTQQMATLSNEIINGDELISLTANIVDNHLNTPEHLEPVPNFVQMVIEVDEDEDQGFAAQFNDDCVSSDDENNNLSNESIQDSNDDLIEEKKCHRQRSQSDCPPNRPIPLHTYRSLPNLYSLDSRSSFEKVEHIIIDDQQPVTTISNLLVKKKSIDDADLNSSQNQIHMRTSSEEILELTSHDNQTTFVVEDSVRDVERHLMLWSDEQARQVDSRTSFEQIVQYFQIDVSIPIEQNQFVQRPLAQQDSLLDYLQYRSETDVSANDLCKNLCQYPEFSSKIYSRFFAFWPPRDVDLLQWLSQWIKQNAFPIAVMNMDNFHTSRLSAHTIHSSWQHRTIYSIEPRSISLMSPIQTLSPQQLYEYLTVDSISHITRQEIVQRYNRLPIKLTPLASSKDLSNQFLDNRWRTMNVLGQVINVLRENRQSDENETRNIPYRPTVTHVRIPSTCSSGILIFSRDYDLLMNANDLPLRQ